MHTISPPKKEGPEHYRVPKEALEKSIQLLHHEINITEGGEFLDDAIRMKDQPIGETNKNLFEGALINLFFKTRKIKFYVYQQTI